MRSTPETPIRRLAVFGGYADVAPEMLWHIGDRPAAPAPARAAAVPSAPRAARPAPALRVIDFDVAPEPVDLRCAA